MDLYKKGFLAEESVYTVTNETCILPADRSADAEEVVGESLEEGKVKSFLHIKFMLVDGYCTAV